MLVIDADQISRQVCEAGSPCLEELVDEFGQDILNDQGELRRKFLGDLVFHDEKKLEKLNAQQDESFYTSRADFVIYNNGDTSELRLETDLVIDVIFGK